MLFRDGQEEALQVNYTIFNYATTAHACYGPICSSPYFMKFEPIRTIYNFCKKTKPRYSISGVSGYVFLGFIFVCPLITRRSSVQIRPPQPQFPRFPLKSREFLCFSVLFRAVCFFAFPQDPGFDPYGEMFRKD